jgi:glucuronosyltransferase
MVVCPFHGDQSGNTERILKKGIAKSLNIHKELKSDEIIEAIQAVIRDESYKGNIVKLAELVEDVPMSSVEKAVWHIEFIIRHKGAQHLKYEQKEIPFYQFHYFDVIFVVFAISLCVLIVCYWLTKKIFKCLYYQTTRIYEDKKNN